MYSEKYGQTPIRFGDKIRSENHLPPISEMFKNKDSIAMSLESKENRNAEILRVYLESIGVVIDNK